jgi:heptosyltransferase III
MRILVLQLARFGEIYQSWPTLRALRRHFPKSEVHFLVRERFQDATEGLDNIVVHAFPAAEILKPIWADAREDLALTELKKFVGQLQDLKFDRIVNLSFSPLSSYLTDLLSPSEPAA